jgi:hypothetical protein
MGKIPSNGYCFYAGVRGYLAYPYIHQKPSSMHQIFEPAIFLKEELHCPKCSWQGPGSDTQQEDLFLTDAIELYCPTCKGYIGFVSAPHEE